MPSRRGWTATKSLLPGQCKRDDELLERDCLRGTTAVLVAAAVSLVAHFLVGAAKSLFTLRTWWSAGLEMTAAGVIVGGATYVLGLFLKVSG